MSLLGESKRFTIFIRKIKTSSIWECACGDVQLNLSCAQQRTSAHVLCQGAADTSARLHAMQATGEAKARSTPGCTSQAFLHRNPPTELCKVRRAWLKFHLLHDPSVFYCSVVTVLLIAVPQKMVSGQPKPPALQVSVLVDAGQLGNGFRVHTLESTRSLR